MTPTSDLRSRIESRNREFVDAFKRADAAGIAGLYTADGLLMPPQSDFVRGTGPIRGFWEAALKMGIAGLQLQTVEVEDLGGTAVEVGRYTLWGEAGATIDDGKYIVVWKDDGGTWKLHRDIWTTSRPAAG